MTWFKVDDGFYSHPKVMTIPRSARAAAVGTWILCGTWSADKLTDGKIPAHMVEEVGGTIDGADALVAVRLWKKTRAGYLFVNWDEFQPRREDVEKNREIERVRKAKQREAAKNRGNAGARPEVVPVGHLRNPNTPSRPVPDPLNQDSISDPHVPSRPISPQDEDGSGDKCLVSIIAAVAEVTGRTIGSFGAVDVRDWIDDRRGRGNAPVKNPSSYYAAAIRNDRFEVQQFIDERNIAS